MRYALDTEFIDTPTCSALISLALVNEKDESLYFEFDYPTTELTPWLIENVVPHLKGKRTNFDFAAGQIREFFTPYLRWRPTVWAYYGAYDWYWFCRIFGGMQKLPTGMPWNYRDFSDYVGAIPSNHGKQHNALNDARSLMDQLIRRNV